CEFAHGVFVGCETPPVSWLGGLQRAAFPSGWPCDLGRTVARSRWAPPYSRAAATAFTVFPNTEFAVIVDFSGEAANAARTRGISLTSRIARETALQTVATP